MENTEILNLKERSEQEQVRFEKLSELRERGFSYPNDVKITALAKDIHSIELAEGDSTDSLPRRTLAGRIMLQRVMGKASFLQLQDSSGKIQVYLRRDDIGVETYKETKQWDIGDIVEITGYPFDTQKGERTIHAESVRLLSKGLIPLPEKWHGISDVETRFRQRYVDLIVNPDVRDVFIKRSKIVSTIRRELEDMDFLEVETPVLHHNADGADARPFETHHNSLGIDMYLRIALELPLKKLVVGGLERVFEIGRVFRNEGISKKHNPEFTMVEIYAAYADYNYMMELNERVFVAIANKVLGSTKIKLGDSEDAEVIDLSTPFKRVSMEDSLYEIGGVSRDYDVSKIEGLCKLATDKNINLDPNLDWGHALEELWGELVEPNIRQPTFITHHPFSISPLARKNDARPEITDRFELVIAGMEMSNGFSELNDPVDQRARMEAQSAQKKKDGNESGIDEDYIRALEYGLPPTGGIGIGVDRLVMLFLNQPSIREIVLFPQLRPDS